MLHGGATQTQTTLVLLVFYILAARRIPPAARPRFRRQRVTPQIDGECSICYGEYAVGTYLAVPACGHRFHHRCLTRWCALKPSCPLCRAPLALSS
jgi:hypothetical protein